eukprot:6487464-Amphidinium_carterae.1
MPVQRIKSSNQHSALSTSLLCQKSWDGEGTLDSLLVDHLLRRPEECPRRCCCCRFGLVVWDCPCQRQGQLSTSSGSGIQLWRADSINIACRHFQNEFENEGEMRSGSQAGMFFTLPCASFRSRSTSRHSKFQSHHSF